MTDPAPVEQVDREAAVDLILKRQKAAGRFSEDESVASVDPSFLLLGHHDDEDVVQSFARHRQPLAARVAELEAGLRKIERRSTPHSDDNDEDRRRDLFLVLSQVRALLGDTK